MDKVRFLLDVILELRTAAKLISSEETFKSTMKKYDMMFLGENFNTIYAREMQHSLEKVFNYHISLSELLDAIPDVCGALDMPIEPMAIVGDPERKLADYQITLF